MFPSAASELNAAQIALAVDLLLDADVESSLKAGFLAQWAQRGESAAELALLIQNLQHKALPLNLQSLDLQAPVCDIVGTGGDRLGLFNVSTTAMFLLAACGVVVCKHGNRAVTSKCGSADVLEALGVNINLDGAAVGKCLQQAGVAFVFAPRFRPLFASVAEARRELAARGIVSFFNKLGPLLNPAQPEYALLGVASQQQAHSYLEILSAQNNRKTWVLRGEAPNGGMTDEASTMGITHLYRYQGEQLVHERLDAASYGLAPATLNDLLGEESAQANAAIIREVLEPDYSGAKLDIAAYNAALALCLCGVAKDLPQALELVFQRHAEGAAKQCLQQLASLSNQYQG